MKSAWLKARVMDASDRNYAATVLSLLEAAKKEIALSLYLVEPSDEAGPEHPVNRFIETLLRARTRGVTVKMVLNTNFRFLPKSGVARGKYFERLLESGVELVTLLPGRRLHDKLIVIDNRFVIDGSMNWSTAALTLNFESVTAMDSPALAQKKLERIYGILHPAPRVTAAKTRVDTTRPLLKVPDSVEIPVALLEKGALSEMIATSDHRAFFLYLALLGQARAAASEDLLLDLETIGGALDLPKDWDRTAVRRQILKVTRKLEENYHLLTAEARYGGDVKIRIAATQGPTVWVPGRLLEIKSFAGADPGEIFLELAGCVLKKEGVEIDSLSSTELETRFGIGQRTIRRSRRSLTS